MCNPCEAGSPSCALLSLLTITCLLLHRDTTTTTKSLADFPIAFLECFLLTRITQSSPRLQTASPEICMGMASGIYWRLVPHSRTQVAVIETRHPGEDATAPMAFHLSPFKLHSSIIQRGQAGRRSQRYNSHNLDDGLHAACYYSTPFVRCLKQDWNACCSFFSLTLHHQSLQSSVPTNADIFSHMR